MKNENKIDTLGLGTVDHAFSELLKLSRSIAKSRATVLIQGASATGKKTIAKYIHENSVRAERLFEVFNARESLGDHWEVDLKKKLDLAIGGTFLIVDISRLSLGQQQKIYEAVQSGTDIRWIATSSEDLSRLVAEGKFREDLFYRFNIVNLKLPSLAARACDIENLVNAFAQKYSKIHSKSSPAFSREAIQYLQVQKWPGNLRELESTIERAVLLSDGNEIRPRDVQVNIVREPVETVQKAMLTQNLEWKPGRTLDEIERNVILEALKFHDGNRTHTAKSLGISIRTLRNKLAEYRVLGIHA